MRNALRGSIVVTVSVALGFVLAEIPVTAQAQVYKAPRAPDGKPNLNGIWQTLNTANWDIQGHAASAGQVSRTGAWLRAGPAGLGVVEGNEIPYLPAAAAKKKQNFEHRLIADPEIKCFLPGVRRSHLYALSISGSCKPPKYILMAYEFAACQPWTTYMGKAPPSPVDTRMWGTRSATGREIRQTSTLRASTTRLGSTGAGTSMTIAPARGRTLYSPKPERPDL